MSRQRRTCAATVVAGSLLVSCGSSAATQEFEAGAGTPTEAAESPSASPSATVTPDADAMSSPASPSNLSETEPPQSVRDVATARALWEASGVTSYTAVVTVRCFCPDSDPLTVEVRDGLVVAVTRDGQPVEDRGWSGPLAPVEDLFNLIAEAERSGTADVTYDRDLGYPKRANLDPWPDAIDDESRHILKVTPLP